MHGGIEVISDGCEVVSGRAEVPVVDHELDEGRGGVGGLGGAKGGGEGSHG